jgi:hypothetical protein
LDVRFYHTFFEKVIITSKSDQKWIEPYEHSISRNLSPNITSQYRLIYYKGQLLFLDINSLQKEIFELEYNSKVSGYIEQDKTTELNRQNFFWPEID